MKSFIAAFLLAFPLLAAAQWAVFDARVYDGIRRINNVSRVNVDKLKDFEDLKDLEVDFSKITSLTEAEKAKYIGTQADCGEEKVNAKHYQACMGLRNLRLQTLKQSQSVLKALDERRKSIDKLIADARMYSDQQSGILQRYHFELQGLQAQMQSDALKLQVLMDGYKQREAVYVTQQAEALKAMLTSQGGKNPRPPQFVPLVQVRPSNN